MTHAAEALPACIVVSCSAGTPENAAAIADALIERRLAACVQLLPVESVYRWADAVKREHEILLHIKTTAARFEAVVATITALHAYDLPEIVAVPVTAISAAYARWIADAVACPE